MPRTNGRRTNAASTKRRERSSLRSGEPIGERSLASQTRGFLGMSSRPTSLSGAGDAPDNRNGQPSDEFRTSKTHLPFRSVEPGQGTFRAPPADLCISRRVITRGLKEPLSQRLNQELRHESPSGIIL